MFVNIVLFPCFWSLVLSLFGTHLNLVSALSIEPNNRVIHDPNAFSIPSADVLYQAKEAFNQYSGNLIIKSNHIIHPKNNLIFNDDNDNQIAFVNTFFPVLKSALIENDAKNTLENCGSDSDIFIPTEFIVLPDPPQRGTDVNVTVNGILNDRIEDGAKIRLKVKLGLITLAVLHFDFCEKAVEFGHECPLEKGPLSISHTAKIPYEVPPGRYTIDINIETVDQRPIACVKANVRF